MRSLSLTATACRVARAGPLHGASATALESEIVCLPFEAMFALPAWKNAKKAPAGVPEALAEHAKLTKLTLTPVDAAGGNVWESNPPGVVQAPGAGFEVREGHQSPSAPALGGNQLLSEFPVKLQALPGECAEIIYGITVAGGGGWPTHRGPTPMR